MSNAPKPKVSVIIPNYNHARFLRQRVDSVIGQTFQDFEVILLDDCSTDESRSIISEYANDSRVRIELNEKNSGSTFKQWNKGVRLARGEYVWIAESDDYADPRLLERLLQVLDTQPDVTFAYCRSWRICEDQPNGFADYYLDSTDPRHWTADFIVDGREECRNYFVGANPVPNASAVVFRKAIYERVGGADEDLRLCGDWKLWASMAFEGKIAYLVEPLNYNREHGATVRSTMLVTGRAAAEYMGMMRWMLQRVTPPEEVRDKAYFFAASLWIPLVVNRGLPLKARWALLRDAVSTDPRALRRLFPNLLASVPLKLAKELRLARQRLQRRAS